MKKKKEQKETNKNRQEEIRKGREMCINKEELVWFLSF